MLLYFSATGNSREVALRLSHCRGDEETIDLVLHDYATPIVVPQGEPLGFVFPVHSWGLPKDFARRLRRLRIDVTSDCYVYMVCTCGDDTGLTAGQWGREMRRMGLSPSAAYSVFMPNTYVLLPGFDVDSTAVRERKLAAVEGEVARISEMVGRRAKGDFTHHGSVAWLKTRVIYPLFMLAMGDRKFRVDEKCRHCGFCGKVCPAGNIVCDADGRPQWLHDGCINCLACYHRCPVKAIAYGHRTSKKGQYFNSFDK